jgi:hemoglobin
MSESLYERIGGKGAIEAAVDIFYGKVLADESISRFFAGVDMDKQRGKQKIFLAFAFGAPVKYDGKDMRQAHKHLVEQGLNDSHFDAVAGHLQATLEELNVPADLIGEVMAIAGGTRDDVLNRPTGQRKSA